MREELRLEGVVFETQTDTEVLLTAYIQWGENCLHRFNGMWAIAIYDRKEKTVFAARDRFGVKPFYYLQTDDFFAFCSDIPPLLSLLQKKPTPEYQIIFDYLAFNRTDQNENTFFAEIKKLQHGNRLKISENKIIIEQWYNLKNQVCSTEGFKNAEEFLQLLSSSIGLRLRSDVPVGICLSGGLDSSSIVSLLVRDHQMSNIKTFSAVYAKGQTGDETEFINEFTPLIKNMHYSRPDADTLEADLSQFIKAQVEPIPSTSPYAQFKVMELAHGKVVVTLDGQGADEQLAGYDYFFGIFFKDMFLQGKFISLISEIGHYIIKHKSLFALKTFLFFMMPKKIRSMARLYQKDYLKPIYAEKYANTNSIAGNLYGSTSLNASLLDHFEYKLEHLLKWEDRNSMWFSIESRVPFLDYRLVEKSLASSNNIFIKNGITKTILREAMKGIIPEKIRMRIDKIGFGTPENEWFRTHQWERIILEILNSDSFSKRNIINPKNAIYQYQRHKSGKIDISKEIWKWIHLEMWFREFID